MTPTEREAEEKISKLIKESIEKDANEYVKQQGAHDNPDITKHDYIAGAEAQYKKYLDAASVMLPQIFHEQLKLERDKARNQAIDECVALIIGLDIADDTIIERFESLKTIR